MEQFGSSAKRGQVLQRLSVKLQEGLKKLRIDLMAVQDWV